MRAFVAVLPPPEVVDQLRIDLDPQPEVPFAAVREVALLVREVLGEHGLVGFPKTSGSRGIHINVRIERRWSFDEVRRAALALAREVEARAPQLVTTKWWKEERHGVFVDYNQNAKDQTIAAAYSVRPTADARVSAPITWDELEGCGPQDFTLANMPSRFAERGDRHAGLDEAVGTLDAAGAEGGPFAEFIDIPVRAEDHQLAERTGAQGGEGFFSEGGEAEPGMRGVRSACSASRSSGILVQTARRSRRHAGGV